MLYIITIPPCNIYWLPLLSERNSSYLSTKWMWPKSQTPSSYSKTEKAPIRRIQSFETSTSLQYVKWKNRFREVPSWLHVSLNTVVLARFHHLTSSTLSREHLYWWRHSLSGVDTYVLTNMCTRCHRPLADTDTYILPLKHVYLGVITRFLNTDTYASPPNMCSWYHHSLSDAENSILSHEYVYLVTSLNLWFFQLSNVYMLDPVGLNSWRNWRKDS